MAAGGAGLAVAPTAPWAIVTGASRGLGAAIARGLWHEGFNLLLTARTTKALNDVVAGLPIRAGQRAEVLAADLCDDGTSALIVNRLRDLEAHRITLVNNAGMQGPIGPLTEQPMDAWQQTVAVNLFAPVALCRAVLPMMQADGYGRIVNLSGGGATGSRPNFTAYAASKAAIVRFTEVLADEVKGTDICVNAVAPGAMGTDMLQAVIDAGPDKAGAREYQLAVKAMSTTGDVMTKATALVAFLSSPACAGITGRLLSAMWDPWSELPARRTEIEGSDIYTLRRIVPGDRGKNWGG